MLLLVLPEVCSPTHALRLEELADGGDLVMAYTPSCTLLLCIVGSPVIG